MLQAERFLQALDHTPAACFQSLGIDKFDLPLTYKERLHLAQRRNQMEIDPIRQNKHQFHHGC
jgi:hypothetical protein